MKRVFITGLFTASISLLQAQQNEGRVIYERTMQIQIQLNDNDQAEHMMPKSRTDKFELNFANNQSIWKHVDEESNADEVNSGGMQIRVMAPGTDDISFFNFDKAGKVEQRELFGKQFLVSDSIRKLNWKLSDDTKEILGHVCRKATAQRIGKRTTMNINNGKMERVEFDDTTRIVAWFTTDIPVPAGPELQGQLPGLILALDMNDGRVTYLAIEFTPKADIAAIKEPTKGKKVTPEGFTAERNKMMEEMQKNNQGGNMQIRIRN
ncbi:MAG: GLPGLI family protein [Chitinophagaceae bacterium]|nr:GLPGLI family protein [Chitinophagaceae bacterium]